METLLAGYSCRVGCPAAGCSVQWRAADQNWHFAFVRFERRKGEAMSTALRSCGECETTFAITNVFKSMNVVLKTDAHMNTDVHPINAYIDRD
eukprot:4154706-Pleurochrysis_carterae.AAC.2